MRIASRSSPWPLRRCRAHQKDPLSEEELLDRSEHSDPVRVIVVVPPVIPNMAKHQPPHTIGRGDQDSIASQDVSRVHCHIIDARLDLVESSVLAQRHKDWSGCSLVHLANCIGELLDIVTLNPHVVWWVFADHECKRHPNVACHIVFMLGRLHQPLQMFDSCEELLRLRVGFKTVDVDDDHDVTQLIQPILDVRHPSLIGCALVPQVSEQVRFAGTELSGELIALLLGTRVFNNLSAKPGTKIPLTRKVLARGGLGVVVHADHGHNRPN